MDYDSDNASTLVMITEDRCRILIKRNSRKRVSLWKIDEQGTIVRAESLRDAKNAEPNLRKKFELKWLKTVRKNLPKDLKGEFLVIEYKMKDGVLKIGSQRNYGALL